MPVKIIQIEGRKFKFDSTASRSFPEV